MENRLALGSLALLPLTSALLVGALGCGPTVALPGDGGPDGGRDAAATPDAGPPPDAGPEPCMHETGSRMHWYRALPGGPGWQVFSEEARLNGCGVRFVSGASLARPEAADEGYFGDAFLAATDRWLYFWPKSAPPTERRPEPWDLVRFAPLDEVPSVLFSGRSELGVFAGGVFGLEGRLLDSDSVMFSTATPIYERTRVGVVPFRPRSIGVVDLLGSPSLIGVSFDHTVYLTSGLNFTFERWPVPIFDCDDVDPSPERVSIDEAFVGEWPPESGTPEIFVRAGAQLLRVIGEAPLCLRFVVELTDDEGVPLTDPAFTVVREDALLVVEGT